MAPAQALDIRPRTTGEILDDAWRLYLADAPRLLLLHGLFHVPAFSLLLILAATQPSSLAVRLLLTFAVALLLPLTGLGSGAVQERLRRLAENRDASFIECVGPAARRCGAASNMPRCARWYCSRAPSCCRASSSGPPPRRCRPSRPTARGCGATSAVSARKRGSTRPRRSASSTRGCRCCSWRSST